MQRRPRNSDTIAAIATPPGPGAISVIRVSGEKAIDVVGSLFHGHAKLADVKGQTVHYGRIRTTEGTIIDEVLVTVFRTPSSYTGEDVVEIGCHGGAIVGPRLLSLILEGGARHADPGEFTRRAFLNGRIDLSQAEAVAEIVSARSRRAQEQSVEHLQGSIRSRSEEIRGQLVRLCSLLEIDLDFSEDAINVVSREVIEDSLVKGISDLGALIKSYESGRILREGVRVAIVGPPNVGKSSLFNALLATDRSIVSDQPGTTRDYVEEALTISGVLFSLVDTAGTRESSEMVEAEGVRRSVRLVDSCDLVLAVADSTCDDHADFWISWIDQNQSRKTLFALNKIDIPSKRSRPQRLLSSSGIEVVATSAKTGEGLPELRENLLRLALGSDPAGETGVVVTSQRHADVFSRASSALQRALESTRSGLSNEFVALDAREAINTVSEITGEVTSEEILNSIFSQFCIGK